MRKFDGVLLACDMDGTLLNSAHEISRENVEALEYFTGNGGVFTIATGRMVHGINLYARELPVNAPIIALNGALIYDPKTDAPLFIRAHDGNITDVASGLIEAFPELGVEFFTLDGIYICRGSEVSRIHCEIIKVPYVFTDIRTIKGDCMKINLTQEPGCLDEAERYINARYPGVFRLVHSDDYFLEILHPDANKGHGLNTVAKMVGIERANIYAIGDHFNDIEMLHGAGHAFAPANAEPEVKKAADLVVASNDEHAIRDVIAYMDKHS